MSDEQPYELAVAPPAARAIAEELPEAVATAVIELVTGTLLREPRSVGKPLRRELGGIWSTRRGTYHILYRINEAKGEVVVLRVEHRGDVYRPH